MEYTITLRRGDTEIRVFSSYDTETGVVSIAGAVTADSEDAVDLTTEETQQAINETVIAHSSDEREIENMDFGEEFDL